MTFSGWKRLIYAFKLGKLKKAGMKIGPGSLLFPAVGSFGSEPYLIRIGDNCLIAAGVQFITHDGAIKVFNRKEEYRSINNKYGKIDIRDNVFIGENSILMPNVTIGPNSFVLPGSVVYRDVPANSVSGGNPAVVHNRVEGFEEQYRSALYPEYKKFFYRFFKHVIP